MARSRLTVVLALTAFAAGAWVRSATAAPLAGTPVPLAAPPEAASTPHAAPYASAEISATSAPTQTVAPSTPAPTPEPTVPPTPVPTPEPTQQPAPILPSPVLTATLVPVPTVATGASPVGCPAGDWFCYPRLGISGAIVPYTDCSGSTDVGSAIRSFTCLSKNYLMAHAWTQFGKITSWQAGDAVFAYGQRFTVTGAFIQQACGKPRLPLEPLEMQTSLNSEACGDVLTVTAR